MKVVVAVLFAVACMWAGAFDDGKNALNRGNYKEAVAQFTQAIADNPNDAVAYYQRGYSYVKLRDHESALPDFSAAIKLDPFYTSAYMYRGVSYIQLGEIDKAAEDAQLACDLADCYLLQTMTKAGQIAEKK